MHTDKNPGNSGLDGSRDVEEEDKDKSLRWLLDMDMEEPEEKLFTIPGEERAEQGLSAYEAEVAGRPLVRGNTTSDDLASYVDEEIVISSDNAHCDIYGEDALTAGADNAQPDSDSGVMAIDYSRERAAMETTTTVEVDEGVDILGLAGDDDMGETYFSIKRVKAGTAESAAESTQSVAEPAENVAEPARDDAELAPAELEFVSSTEQLPPIAELPSLEEIMAVDADQELPPHEEIMAHDADQELPQLEEFGAFQVDAPQDEIQQEQFQLDDVLHFEAPQDEAEQDARELQDAEDESGIEAWTVETVEQASAKLTDAPVTTLIAEPGSDRVANEEAASADTPFVLSAENDGEIDALGALPGLLDDEAFDDFLLGAQHIEADDEDIQELSLEDEAVFTGPDVSLTEVAAYAQDILPIPGMVQDSALPLDTLFAAAREDIAGAVAARMEELGIAADSVTVEVMAGSDEQSIMACYAQGYEPVSAVCPQLPDALNAATVAQRDALYVKLHNVELNKNWNDLFSPDFTGLLVEEAAPLDDIFGQDIFGDDFAAEFDADLSLDDAASSDIEAAFASLGKPESGSDEICGVDVDEFDSQQHSAETGEVADSQDVDAAAEQADTLEVQHVAEPAGPAFDEEVDAAMQLAAVGADGMGWAIPDYINFNYTTASNAEIFADFLDAFIEEGSAEVEKLENLVGEWEKDVNDEPLFAEVGRNLHTIKGIAKGVGLQRLGTLVHNFETLLESLPRPEEGGELAYFRIVNVWLDALVRGVEFVTEQREDIASELPVQAGEAPATTAIESDTVEPAARVELQSVPVRKKSSALSALEKKRDQQLADEGAKVLAAQQSVRMTSEKLDHLLNLASQAQQLGVRASQNTSRSKRSSAELQGRLTSVRTHIRKIADRALLNVNARGSSTPDLDALEMDQYSELQEAASILREGVEDLTDLVDVVSRQNAQIEALLKQQSTVISSISSSIQGARVVPVSRLMPGLRRIVRTVSTDLGKVVSFKVLNETGALDRDHYARLQVILEHMVRNALDHGIESPDDRVALGKPTGGRITIDVRKAGGDYVIKLSDDGKGIDPDAIRESAYEKGLDVDVDAMSDDEAIRLVFHKGFSTAASLSEISGRGVGMDIVLTELQQIGGDIQIQSAVGLGTSFEVRIPSNVSVNGALLVRAAGDSYAIPLNGLVAVEQVPVEAFLSAANNGDTLALSDMDCEPAYLATLCQGVGLPDPSTWDDYVPVIIAGSEDRYMAIAIDSLEEALELVVRSLGSQFSTVPGVAGAATTADGEAIVALDLNQLVASAGADGIAPVAVTKSEDTRLLALVVDDSRTQRMVATSQLDTVGVETVTAENGLVAIDLLNTTHRLPDVVLLDVEMPVKDGIETLREIRKSRRYGDLPVIMVTSRTGAKHRALAKEAGCNAYMGKPFNFPALIEQINELTGHELQVS